MNAGKSNVSQVRVLQLVLSQLIRRLGSCTTSDASRQEISSRVTVSLPSSCNIYKVEGHYSRHLQVPLEPAELQFV